MKKRVLTNWSFIRVLYTAMGFGLVYYSISERQWFGTIIGIYFIAMGVFAIGCASGSCYGGDCEIDG